ncbi:MAG: hypothetical protein J6Y89_08585 [Lachnospiraceae bacterium]|nr:hypothetical protein [Lachnospiraceae bacterium]
MRSISVLSRKQLRFQALQLCKSLPIGLTVKTVNAIEAGDKKTADGTQLRVLVVVTHADKTVEVFESGAITIGEKAE